MRIDVNINLLTRVIQFRHRERRRSSDDVLYGMSSQAHWGLLTIHRSDLPVVLPSTAINPRAAARENGKSSGVAFWNARRRLPIYDVALSHLIAVAAWASALRPPRGSAFRLLRRLRGSTPIPRSPLVVW